MVLRFPTLIESDLGWVRIISGGILSTGPPPGLPLTAHVNCKTISNSIRIELYLKYIRLY